jgi:hypothetical protein
LDVSKKGDNQAQGDGCAEQSLSVQQIPAAHR